MRAAERDRFVPVKIPEKGPCHATVVRGARFFPHSVRRRSGRPGSGALAEADTGGAAAQLPSPSPPATKPPAAQPPVRSEAMTLLATLQREARFVDFIQEPLAGYSDAQIGAAARDVHRDCGTVLERLFALRPVVPDEEGAEVEVPAGFDAGRYRLTGNVAGEPPFRGRLVHPRLGGDDLRVARPGRAARRVGPESSRRPKWN